MFRAGTKVGPAVVTSAGLNRFQQLIVSVLATLGKALLAHRPSKLLALDRHMFSSHQLKHSPAALHVRATYLYTGRFFFVTEDCET